LSVCHPFLLSPSSISLTQLRKDFKAESQLEQHLTSKLHRKKAQELAKQSQKKKKGKKGKQVKKEVVEQPEEEEDEDEEEEEQPPVDAVMGEGEKVATEMTIGDEAAPLKSNTESDNEDEDEDDEVLRRLTQNLGVQSAAESDSDQEEESFAEAVSQSSAEKKQTEAGSISTGRRVNSYWRH
jgi:hypothetical protein